MLSNVHPKDRPWIEHQIFFIKSQVVVLTHISGKVNVPIFYFSLFIYYYWTASPSIIIIIYLFFEKIHPDNSLP